MSPNVSAFLANLYKRKAEPKKTKVPLPLKAERYTIMTYPRRTKHQLVKPVIGALLPITLNLGST